MGYEDPTQDIDQIVESAALLRQLVAKQYDFVSDAFRDVFLTTVRAQTETLKNLANSLANYGEAGKIVARGFSYPDLPDGFISLEWTAVAGVPVWRVGRIERGGRILSPSRRDFDPPPDEAEIAMYLDKYDEDDLKRIQDAAMQLAASLGYEDFSLLDDERGSIFRRWVAKVRSGLESDYVRRRMEEIEERTSLEVIGKVRAENDAIKTDSAIKLIASLAEIPNAVVRVGGIMVIKQTVNGFPNVLLRELSTKEIRVLEQNPGIQRDPAHALELLSLAVRELDDDPDSD